VWCHTCQFVGRVGSSVALAGARSFARRVIDICHISLV
jgi:hypothetical protein